MAGGAASGHGETCLPACLGHVAKRPRPPPSRLALPHAHRRHYQRCTDRPCLPRVLQAGFVFVNAESGASGMVPQEYIQPHGPMAAPPVYGGDPDAHTHARTPSRARHHAHTQALANVMENEKDDRVSGLLSSSLLVGIPSHSEDTITARDFLIRYSLQSTVSTVYSLQSTPPPLTDTIG